MLKILKNKPLKNNTQKYFNTIRKDNSKGRSMLEMLGVLAIIGVLSIGGIQGYTLAMRRMRANEILDLANKYAFTLYTGCETEYLNTGIMEYSDSGDTLDCQFLKTAFSNLSIGSVPQGVYIMGPSADLSYPYMDLMKTMRVRIKPLDQGGSLVTIPILFTDKSLCETVDSILGTDESMRKWSIFSSDADKSDSCGRKISWGPDNETDVYHLNAISIIEN